MQPLTPLTPERNFLATATAWPFCSMFTSRFQAHWNRKRPSGDGERFTRETRRGRAFHPISLAPQNSKRV